MERTGRSMITWTRTRMPAWIRAALRRSLPNTAPTFPPTRCEMRRSAWLPCRLPSEYCPAAQAATGPRKWMRGPRIARREASLGENWMREWRRPSAC
eukprot:scaffold135_cov249-Pinguiococcus_pyrenoidosus.AAC.10